MRSDTLNGAAPTSWNANYLYGLPTYVAGVYYWNNNSGDGPQANVGWCLVGGAQCGMQNPPGYLPYYSSGGSAPADMYFTSSGSGSTVTLRLTLTDQKGQNGNGIDEFGIYLTDATGHTISDPTVIFSSTDTPGSKSAAVTLAAGQNYGFFIENVQGVGTSNETRYFYYMDSTDNTATGSMPADSMQHFAVFSDGATYYIGAVDGDACQGPFHAGTSPCIPASEFDFNDFIVQVNPAPEPASTMMVGAGLLLLGAIVRRGVRRS